MNNTHCQTFIRRLNNEGNKTLDHINSIVLAYNADQPLNKCIDKYMHVHASKYLHGKKYVHRYVIIPTGRKVRY